MKLLKKKEEEKRNKHKQQNIIQDVELICNINKYNSI